MPLVARLLTALALVCAVPGIASKLEFRPAELPPEVRRLNSVVLTADVQQFVMTGLSADGSCAVGLLNEHFTLVGLTFLSLVLPEFVPFRGFRFGW